MIGGDSTEITTSTAAERDTSEERITAHTKRTLEVSEDPKSGKIFKFNELLEDSHRRLISLARLLQGESTCVALYLTSEGKLYVTANDISEISTKKASFSFI